MNDNKTAITEMRQYAESWLDSGIEYSRGQIIEAMVNKARALETSQAERDKGLVEELRDWAEHYGGEICPLFMSDMEDILSRHEKGAN